MRMKAFIIGVFLLGFVRGVTNMPSSLVGPALMAAVALQVWKNPSACLPLLMKDALPRRYPVMEFVLTGTIGLAALLLGFFIGSHVHH